MKRIPFSVLALLITMPALAQDRTSAQDDTTASPVFVVSAHQCDWAGLEALVERDRARTMPIVQALVDEGKLIQAGEAVHHWGDDYNLLTWLAAPDMPSALAAYDEMTARYNEAHPDDSLFSETCPKHRDSFYTLRAGTQAGDSLAGGSTTPVGEGNTPTLAVSYYTCDYTKLGALLEEERARALPIAQALVDEGALGSHSAFTHEWGDEWNYVITWVAPDLPALLGALDTFGERYEAEHGENPRTTLEQHCSAHKDNIYTMMMATTPAN